MIIFTHIATVIVEVIDEKKNPNNLTNFEEGINAIEKMMLETNLKLAMFV